jgi:arylsulfatase A-like enzyme
MQRVFIFSLFLLMAILSLMFFKQENKKNCGNCNVILISIDTLRPDHLGTYRYGRKTSPNIDEFAKKARVFNNFYATSSWTLPSHASMLASDFPTNLKMQTVLDKMSSDTLTIAKVLGQNGYKTAIINSGTFVSSTWGFDVGFDEEHMVKMKENLNDVENVFSKGREWLRENRDNNFFLFLHVFQVHDPYCPPKEFDKFKGDYKGGLNCVDTDTHKVALPNRSEEKLSEEEQGRYVSLYDGEILYTDYYVGEFLKELAALGIDKETIVIITSDHGEEFGERGYFGVHEYTLYDELIRVPLLIKAPNIDPGIEDGFYSLIDIPPSILDLLGLKIPDAYKGVSVNSQLQERSIHFELSDTKIDFVKQASGENSNAVPQVKSEDKSAMRKEGFIKDGWKLLLNYDSSPQEELYNLKNDPGESQNVASKNKDKVLDIKNTKE